MRFGHTQGFAMLNLRHLSARTPMILRFCARLTIVALLVVGSRSGHLLLVAHTRCAEHGELVHGGQVHHRALPEPWTGSSPSAEPDHRPVESGEHEHCALSGDRREVATEIGGAAVATAPLRAKRAEERVGRERAVETCARFRVAPKNSPPA